GGGGAGRVIVGVQRQVVVGHAGQVAVRLQPPQRVVALRRGGVGLLRRGGDLGQLLLDLVNGPWLRGLVGGPQGRGPEAECRETGGEGSAATGPPPPPQH